MEWISCEYAWKSQRKCDIFQRLAAADPGCRKRGNPQANLRHMLVKFREAQVRALALSEFKMARSRLSELEMHEHDHANRFVP